MAVNDLQRFLDGRLLAAFVLKITGLRGDYYKGYAYLKEKR